jgi:2-C-methyl-D-erythritol 2,4-cyclodiphosphate synthase
MLRVGIGYDCHPLVPERKLILGGVYIPFDKGLSGHSDADVVAHAIIDALCGAADLGDIGTQFPPENPEYENISSLTLLSKIAEQISRKEFKIVNIDVTIIAQRPKLSPLTTEMRKQISHSLNIKTSQITVKTTTTNGLGFIGREEGIAAQSIALIREES